jgi:hypothetical protein
VIAVNWSNKDNFCYRLILKILAKSYLLLKKLFWQMVNSNSRIFCNMTLHSAVGRYQHFGRTCCLMFRIEAEVPCSAICEQNVESYVAMNPWSCICDEKFSPWTVGTGMRVETFLCLGPQNAVTLYCRSMELAMSAKEPYNYFLLLRALFRSIGGGSHDLLYQEFLPLLPNLLQGNVKPL